MSNYVRRSTTGAIKANTGNLRLLICNNSASGTIALWNNPSAASGDNPVAIPMTTGQVINFGTEGVDFTSGIWAVLGGTIDVTAVYD